VLRTRAWFRALLVGSLAMILAGCSSADVPRFGMPEPASDSARIILSLWQGSWIAAWVVGAFVWGLMIWAVIAYRRRGDHLPAQTRYNVPIEALYTVVPFIIVAVLFVFTARDQTALTAISKDSSSVHVVNVNAIRWSWQFSYDDADGATVTGTPGDAPTLVLPQGERVRFVLTTSDVNHSFWVPAFAMKMDHIAGRTNSFELTPEKLGTYAGKCAELCGRLHYRMLFNVKVVTPSEYDAYIEELKGAGA
jgi:cytochrome c oxidase subunit II